MTPILNGNEDLPTIPLIAKGLIMLIIDAYDEFDPQYAVDGATVLTELAYCIGYEAGRKEPKPAECSKEGQ